MPFYLSISNFSKKETIPGQFQVEIYDSLTENQAISFLKLQELATSEISQEINILSKAGLTSNLPGKAKCFLILLLYNTENLVGYGYSYEDVFKGTIYIDTIFVLKKYRGQRLGHIIVESLIEKSVNQLPSVNRFKAVTQPNNEAAIKLLTNLGFKHTINL